MTPQPDPVLSHYRLADRIGEGGMGVVYRAVDTKLRRDVAIKFLSKEPLSKQRAESFLREARLAAALNHPNVCTVHEVGEVPEGETPLLADGFRPPARTPFLVMELVEAAPLDERRPAGPLALNELLDVAVQIAGALTEAHARGIVHRDLKPGNVMVTADGRVKILDFGVARTSTQALDQESATITLGEGLSGTPAYMSPEQARGEQVDARSDIFSFGTMLYELVAGRRPFLGDSTPRTLVQVLEAEPQPLSEQRSDLPPELERIVGRCLRKQPERRYNDTRDLLNALQDLRAAGEHGRVQAGVGPASSDPRQDALAAWCAKQRIPGFKAETVAQIFGYVIGQQEPGGGWPGQGDHWSEVKTACILKALAGLGYDADSRWTVGEGPARVDGGIRPSLDFLSRKFSRLTLTGGLVGEDLWDTCQALLALAAFGEHDAGKQYVAEIRTRWQEHYRRACESVPRISWSGPSYLSAMGDVLAAYRSILDVESPLGEMLRLLGSLEQRRQGRPTGAYEAVNSDDPGKHRWNTALVLRSLAAWPATDPEAVARTASWILDQLDRADRWLGPTDRESPMYLARCLDGLHAAAPHAAGALAGRIGQALEYGNARLDALWSPLEDRRTGDLKAYSAVVEYLSRLTLAVPAGLVVGGFDPRATESEGHHPR